MGKLTTYITILATIVIGFHLAGLVGDTPSSWLVGLAMNPQDAFNHSFYTTIAGILILFGGVGAIIIGAFAPQRLDQAATIVATSMLFVVGWDLISIFNQIRNVTWLGNILSLFIIGPLMILYILTCIEWWRGKD